MKGRDSEKQQQVAQFAISFGFELKSELTFGKNIMYRVQREREKERENGRREERGEIQWKRGGKVAATIRRLT